MLKSYEIADLLDGKSKDFDAKDPLIITPSPRPKDLRTSGSASLDLHIGAWFVTLREARLPYLKVDMKGMSPDARSLQNLKSHLSELEPLITEDGVQHIEEMVKSIQLLRKRNEIAGNSRLTKTHYVRFGDEYYLHPHHFVLGITLEWIRLPCNIAGYLTSRSKWGRRGLVIATATGVHPGFKGCLTLELCNAGEIPIALRPGMAVCQMFLHRTGNTSIAIDKSKFIGKRKPVLGEIKIDEDNLSKSLAIEE